jgi:DNA recombination protein RmuC
MSGLAYLFIMLGIIGGFALALLVIRRAQAKVDATSRDAFKAMSADAVREANKAIVDLAEQRFSVLQQRVIGEMEKRRESVDGMVRPIRDTLTKYEEHIQNFEMSRQRDFSALREQIDGLAKAQGDLRRETGNLVTALRKPQVRGRWGEMTLKRVVELAGMVEHCDFNEQVTVGDSRPDMIVHLPAGRTIVIDAKVALDAYLDYVEAQDESKRSEALARHALQMKEHVRKLSAKAYWSMFENAPEFVVMFVPGESFLSAAADRDPSMIDDAMASKVIPASPTSLVALLRSVAWGWRQEMMADNARKISETGRELYERLAVMTSHVSSLGKSLNKSVDSYNHLVGSLETRVLVTARKFEDAGVVTPDGLQQPELIEKFVREPSEG